MDFLDTLENIRQEASSARDIFAGEGRTVHSVRRNNLAYEKRVAKTAIFLSEVYSGKRPVWQLREVMTTSDFPYLFGDVLDRSVLAEYQTWETTWDGIAKPVVVNDFRQAKVYPPLYGADGPLDEVAEVAPYPAEPLTEQEPFLWGVRKHGRTVPMSWETLINDDLNQIKEIPEKLGRAAKRTENAAVTSLYVGTAGPHTSLYHNNFANIINTTNGASDDNPPLSIMGLQDAYTVLNKMVDEAGNPIRRNMVTLVVPPALEIIAQNILSANQLWITAGAAGGMADNHSGGGFQQLNVNNWMRGRFTLKVDPYIPLTNLTSGNTNWYLFANPTDSREAIRIGFLRGHETPEIWIKSPNAQRVGGGQADPMDGDFATDSIVYKVRHVVGSTRVDPKATVASNGTGS